LWQHSLITFPAQIQTAQKQKLGKKCAFIKIRVYFDLTNQQQLKHFSEEGGEQKFHSNDYGRRNNVIRLERRLI